MAEGGFVVRLLTTTSTHLESARQAVKMQGGEAVGEALPGSTEFRKALLDLKSTDPAGILITYPEHHDLLAEFERQGVSTVVCGHRRQGHNFVTGNVSHKIQVALEHLNALGHRDIALAIRVSGPQSLPTASELRASWREGCARQGIDHCTDWIEEAASERDLRPAWATLRKLSPRPTAIVCSDNLVAGQLIGLARKSRVTVPADLSLVSLMENAAALQSDPPLTTVDIDIAAMIRIAAFVLCDDIRLRRERPLSTNRQAIVCEPVIHTRGSTREADRNAPAAAAKRRWSDDEPARRQAAERLIAERFPALAKSARFHPLDLGAYVNRSFTPRSSWLGDLPLRNFEPGRHLIHGVPFDVAGGGETRDSAIVLRSRKVHASGSEPLPVSVEIPVDRQARSIFILHAAGWIRHHETFARYEFRFGDGSAEELDVLAYGRKPSDATTDRKLREEATVQDWHPTFPVLHSSHALPCLVTQDGDPFLYERYLYVCRWSNPHPDRVMKSIVIRSLDPEIRATLAVIAITLED